MKYDNETEEVDKMRRVNIWKYAHETEKEVPTA